VRDNIHSEDVAAFMHQFYESPRRAEVYNLGGGKDNSCSVLEAMELVEGFSGRRQAYTYVDQHRLGDHICYYSDLRKMKGHYPTWSITKDLSQIVSEIVRAWQERLVAAARP
jgi:CDP-paratose 2-epimerase